MKTVILVDRDAAQRRGTADFLRARGWQVGEAEDGAAALALGGQEAPQAAVCSLVGAQPAGLEACQTLRRDPRWAQTRIIALSRRDCECDRLTALEAGADECLAQATDLELLIETLDRLVSPAAKAAAGVAPELRTSLRFWGVRGSTPTPGPSTVRYGGNTSCVEVRSDGEIIILDAGTGLRPLGRSLAAEFHDRPLSLTLLLTHTHWDHIHGLPYFLPMYRPTTHLRILGYEGARRGLASVLSAQMESPYFPISFDRLPGSVAVEELKEMEFHVGRVRVQAHLANHPGTCVGYRLSTPQGSIAFFPDNEIGCRHRGSPQNPADPARLPESAEDHAAGLTEFLRGVDVLVMDAQYTAAEYQEHLGWGHGCVDAVVALALKAQVRQLFLFHHDPDHDDAQISRIVEGARKLVSDQRGILEVQAAREGLAIELSLPSSTPAATRIKDG